MGVFEGGELISQTPQVCVITMSRVSLKSSIAQRGPSRPVPLSLTPP
jgi:hypothetical protein